MSKPPPWWRRLLSRLIEYLTLRRAMAFAEGLHDDRRMSLRQGADGASQKRDAAELLRSRGSSAEAIRLALEAAELLTTSLQGVADSSLVQIRAVRRAALDLKWASAELTPPSALDRGVTRAHGRALRTLLAAELAIGPPVREALLDRKGLLVLRVQRILAVAAIVLSPFAVAVFVRRSFYGPTARASGTLDDQYTADRVLDGDPDTEWVANGADEWLELRFHRQTVHGVQVLNGDTLPDRAAKAMRADFYSGSNLLGTASATFNPQHPAQWHKFDVGRMVCDRIRIVITEHYGAGAAIAEVQVY